MGLDVNYHVYQFLTGLSARIVEWGDLGQYTYEFTTRGNRTVLVLQTYNTASVVEIYHDKVNTTFWTNEGVKHNSLKRLSTEEERFQESLIQDVLSTENELAACEMLKMLNLYLRDDLGLYHPDVYEK